MTQSKRLNEDFINVLGEMHDFMIRKGESFRGRAYKIAEEAIINYPDSITDPKKQLKNVPGIGTTIMAKFEEYKETGKLSALERERNDPANILAEVFGIGPKKAKELVAAGITNITDLRDNTDMLNDKQRLGLKYYDDIKKRIPRDEIEEFNKTFKKIFDKVVPNGSKFEVVGSYRRGAKTSGDIDIIITNDKDNRDAFDNVLDQLLKDNIITAVLSRGKTKSMTVVEIKKDGPKRRVDFLYSPLDEYAFALFYFTGSKIFNTVVRQKAVDLGYTLNEHGLSYFTKGVKGKKVDEGFPTEESIMNFLGIKYKKPEERIDGRSVIKVGGAESKAESKAKSNETSVKEDKIEESNPAEQKTTMIIIPKKGKKKNLTLKKTPSPNINTLVEKFKSEGISALKLMTESELSKIIRQANTAYYCNDKPILSDTLYDIIREYVLEKYPKNEAANEGHTKCEVEMSKTKVKLPYEMWSMDKIKPTTDALSKWLKTYKGPYVVSAKLDGISALYVADEEPKLYTRGNGQYGQDITPLIPYLIRKDKSMKGMTVRGEIIIEKATFDKKYADKFSNARNFVAGVVNKKTIDPDVLNDLDFVPYEVIDPIMKPSEQLKSLNKSNSVVYKVKDKITNEVLSELLLDWRKDYKYEIDGVIVVNDEIYPRPTKNPEYAFAFKMVISDQVAEAKVVDVLWAPSKDGYLKPRVQIEPVTLGGAKIEFATGFNARYIVDNNIGIGSVVSIIRSGEVIPHIVSVVVPAEKPLLPSVPYKWNDTHVDIILVNKEDDVTVHEKNVTAFFKGIGVHGLGAGNIKRIIEAGYDTVPKIIGMNKDDFLKVPGFKEKTATKLYNGIKYEIDKATLSELMAASNVFGHGFGEKRFKLILKMYPDILLSRDTDKKKITDLIKIEGIASKTAERFVEKIPEFVEFMKIAKLLDKKHEKDEKDEEDSHDKDHVLYGKKIVFTGGKDKELIEELKKIGAEISSSVSKNTFIVIAKTQEEDTGKADAARKLNIPIMTVSDFRKKYID